MQSLHCGTVNRHYQTRTAYIPVITLSIPLVIIDEKDISDIISICPYVQTIRSIQLNVVNSIQFIHSEQRYIGS